MTPRNDEIDKLAAELRDAMASRPERFDYVLIDREHLAEAATALASQRQRIAELEDMLCDAQAHAEDMAAEASHLASIEVAQRRRIAELEEVLRDIWGQIEQAPHREEGDGVTIYLSDVDVADVRRALGRE